MAAQYSQTSARNGGKALPQPWPTIPIYGAWRKDNGELRPGTYKVSSNSEVTHESGAIFPRGVLKTGNLNTDLSVSEYSFEFESPPADDPTVFPQQWELTITIRPFGANPVIYRLHPSALWLPAGLDLRRVAVPDQLGDSLPVIIGGVPGGFAKLDAQGRVLDGSGNPVLSGDGELSDAEMLEVVNDVVTAFGDQLEPDVDFVVWFENQLQS